MVKRWSKLVALSGLAGLLLAACGGEDTAQKTAENDPEAQAIKEQLPEGAELTHDFKSTYANDPLTLDYLQSNRSTTSEHVVNFVDPLYETDQYGNYTPALAKDYQVSEDGLTWTYTLREGVQWVDVDGNDYAEVKAQDFVTGLKHAADVDSEALPIVSGTIKNLRKYMDGEIKDFAEVGVKAVDDHTLQYTLEKPEPYFNTKTTYGILYPVNEEFLKSKGKDFGALQPDSILYCGPYRLANLTAKSAIEYVKNDRYWDKDNVHIDTVTLTYNDGSDLESFFRMFNDDALVAFTVFPNLPIFDQVKQQYADAITVKPAGPGSYYGQFNFNRQAYQATLKKNDKQKEDTRKAILNRDFRQAFLFGFNRKAYMAQQVGDEYANGRLRNTIVPPNFVMVGDKEYGDILQSQLQELDPEHFGDVKLADGQDGYYNADKAKKIFAEAKQALAADGVDFPIHIDLPIQEQDDIQVNWGKSMKQTIEASLGKENVVLDLNLLNQDKYNAATYNATSPDAVDYDITTASGWTPDFRDPSTYLSIAKPDHGDMLVAMGLSGDPDKDQQIKEKAGLKEYGDLYEQAVNEVNDLNKRYTLFAEAEAVLLRNVLFVPINLEAAVPRVTKAVPFTGSFAFAGPTELRYKYLRLQDKPVTVDQYNKLKDEWNSQLAAENKKAAEEEAKHFAGEKSTDPAETESSEGETSEH